MRSTLAILIPGALIALALVAGDREAVWLVVATGAVVVLVAVAIHLIETAAVPYEPPCPCPRERKEKKP